MEGIKYVRLGFMDIGNIPRFRILPIARFRDFLKTFAIPCGITMSTVALAMLPYQDIVSDELPDCIGVSREFILAPDVTSLRKLPYGTGTNAICMADLMHKTYVDNQPVPFEGCPRQCLKNVVK